MDFLLEGLLISLRSELVENMILAVVLCIQTCITNEAGGNMKDYNNEYYHIIADSCNNRFPWLVSSNDSAVFYAGEEIDAEEEFVAEYDDLCDIMPGAGQADFYTYDSMNLIISECVKNALSEMNLKQVQFVPVSVVDRAGISYKGFISSILSMRSPA